jgi:hypothetical protein
MSKQPKSPGAFLVRTVRKGAGLRLLVVVFAFLLSANVARADLIITNAAGVRAGITGIVHHQEDNSIGVDFSIVDPTGTNVTSFTIQRSLDLVSWPDYTAILMVTGSISGEVSDFATSTKQFYRMRLINFR